MTVHRVISLGIAAAVLALAGCGGGSPSGSGVAPSQAPASSAPASAPSTAPSSQASSQPSASQSSEPTSGGDDGSKPTKSEIVAGLTAFYESSQGLPAAKAKKFATCMVDQMYGKAKLATLMAMRDGDPTKVAASDAGLLAESGLKCQSALK